MNKRVSIIAVVISLTTVGVLTLIPHASQNSVRIADVVQADLESYTRLVDTGRTTSAHVRRMAEAVSALEARTIPRLISQQDFVDALNAAHVVFLSDVHGDPKTLQSHITILSWLKTVFPTHIGYVGLELAYDDWLTKPPAEFHLAAASLYGESFAHHSSTLLREVRRHGWRPVALHRWDLNLRPFGEGGGSETAADIEAIMRRREEWVAVRLEALGPGSKALAIYGRAHLFGGELPQLTAKSLVIVGYDPQIWKVAIEQVSELSHRKLSETTIVRMSKALYLLQPSNAPAVR